MRLECQGCVAPAACLCLCCRRLRPARRPGGRLSGPPGAHHRRLSARRLDRHSPRACSRNGWAKSSASSSSSRTSPAPATTSAPNRPPRPRRMATRCSWPIRPTPSTPRSTSISISCSCATSMPVAGFIRVPNVMEVNPSVPVKTVAEFIAYVKANPDKINMASSGNGTSIHLSGELFKMMTGLKITHVPYKGSAPMLTDLLGGQVQVTFDNLPSSIGHIKAGKLRALGGDHRDALAGIAGCADGRRDRARLRSERLLRSGCAERHAEGGHRHCSTSRSMRRSRIRACRKSSHDLGGILIPGSAGGFRQAPGRRNRQVGKGGPRRRSVD